MLTFSCIVIKTAYIMKVVGLFFTLCYSFEICSMNVNGSIHVVRVYCLQQCVIHSSIL